jgi:hypothetical protein
MKYIKLFEKIKYPTGKYLVFKFKTNFIIAELIKLEYNWKDEIEIYTKRLYNCHESGITKTEQETISAVYTEDMAKRIIYQSDDLDHILDIADSFFSVQKYNL